MSRLSPAMRQALEGVADGDLWRSERAGQLYDTFSWRPPGPRQVPSGTVRGLSSRELIRIGDCTIGVWRRWELTGAGRSVLDHEQLLDGAP